MSPPRQALRQQITLHRIKGWGGNPNVWVYYSGERHHLGYSKGNPSKDGRFLSGGGFAVSHVVSNIGTGPLMDFGFRGFEPFNNHTRGPTSNFIFRNPGTQLLTMPKVTRDPSSLDGKGATGWARARPGNPMANTAVFTGELRNLPSLPGRQLARLKRFQALGSEYLNYQFGWKPFVSDLQKMYETYRKLDQRLAQIRRDNGRGIRRRVTLDDTTTTDVRTTTGGWDLFPVPPGGYGFQMTTTSTYTVSKKTWFAGRFRYYIPDIGTSQWTRRATRALYGANVTPDVLYELLPWSWLADYFTNVGDIVTNLSPNAVGNPTADYAYIMETTSELHTWTTSGWVITKRGTVNFNITSHNEVTTKTRGVATPYGFGIKWDGLNNHQLGILAALGISRSRF